MAIFPHVFDLIIGLAVTMTVGGVRETRTLARRVEELTDHVIVCGYGRAPRGTAIG